MKAKRTKSILCAFLLPALLLCACTAGEETELPEGKFPMTFTTSMESLTATRANTAEDQWTTGDRIAVQVGDKVKEYTPTAINGNSATLTSDDPFYWQSTTEAVTVDAWYPYNETKPALTIKANQNENGNYQASDFLEATAEVSYNNVPSLQFKHRTAKVIVTLTAGSGVDLSGATVSFVNQVNVESGEEVTAKSNSPTYTALLAPQQMQGKQFIKVTAGGNDYYYTPTQENDANLEAGKQYSYTITVNKTELVVTAETSASWKDETSNEAAQTATSFNIAVKGNIAGITAGGSGSISESGGSYTLSGSNEFTVKVTEQGGKFLKGISVDGFYELKSVTLTSSNYEYTCIAKGDLSLTIGEFAEKTTPVVGDYYYSDGTWSADLWEKPCVGIVFKVGAGNNDNISDYDSKLTGQINGYAVSLQDAARFNIKWSTVQENCNTSTATDDYKGYDNTKKIRAMSGYSQMSYPVSWAVALFNNTTPAPSCTSGWYLPSAGQMIDIINSWKSNGTIQQKLNALPYNHPWKTPTTEHGYATSTEDNDNASQKVCRIGSGGSVAKEAKDYSDGNFAVRPVLTF